MSKYQVWQVECAHCGDVSSYGEDEGSIPETCINCKASGDWWDDDAVDEAWADDAED